MELDALFNKYGTDKDKNGYSPVYHSLFKNIRDQPIDFLEIGIGTMIPDAYSTMAGFANPGYAPGGSLRAWRDYFANGHIVGVDIQPDTQFTEERIQTFLCNTIDSSSVSTFFENVAGKQFDVILDDGAHQDVFQLFTFKHFYPALKPGGTYIIEDVNPGSRILGTFYPFLKKFASDALIYATYIVDPGPKIPILIISKRK